MTELAIPRLPEEDSPEARDYNRKKRWLELADTAIGAGVLVILLVTGWTMQFRDRALSLARDHYAIALFLYVVMLAALAKIVGFGLEFYSFRLEHKHHLSTQSFGSWMLDEVKGWLVGVVLGTIVAELIYWLIRTEPQNWWVWAWLSFIVLFVVFAQLAPVVLFPIFYKFVPLENDELKARLVRLSEAAGTRVRGVYEWKLSEKSKKANAALTGLGNTRRIITV